jgi:hypothetical protein
MSFTNSPIPAGFGVFTNTIGTQKCYMTPSTNQISATGGTITTYSADGTTYKVHTFTINDVFEVVTGGLMDILVVGGGGSGSITSSFFYEGTGG